MSATQEVIKTCFQDIVSIKGGCGDIVSTSGRYANDIDITPDFINDIITREYKGPKDFFDKKLDFAIVNVINESLAILSKKLKTGTVLNDFRIGQFQDNLKLIAGDGKLKGINIDLCNSDSYLNLFVNEISLQLNHTGDKDVFVYDLIQNKLLDTITVACVANEISTVFPAKEYYSPRKKLNLLFAYNSTGVDSNTTYLTSSGNCRNCSGNKGISNSFERVNGARIASGGQMIKSNLTLSNETGGMSIVHSLQCNHSQWMCTFSNQLALPILYKLGELIVEFALTVSPNDRINTTTELNKEELQNRLSFYSAKYKDSISSLLSDIQPPSDSRCFNCRDGVRHVISTQ